MRDIDYKLLGEQLIFNCLMYAVIFSGGALTILVYLIGVLVYDRALSYVAPIFSATMYAATLCHFLLHQASSYLALHGSDDIKKYEARRRGHGAGAMMVGLCNFGFLLVMVGIVADSLTVVELNNGMTRAVLYGLFGSVSLVLFAAAPYLAAKGWKKKV